LVVNGEWGRFARALDEALAVLPLHGVLIITDRTRPWHFIQYAHEGDHIRAEAVGGVERFGRSRLCGLQRETPTVAGWHPPAGGCLNWWWRLDWPAPVSDSRRLADNSVRAFREAYGTASPATLEYEAWVDGFSAAGQVQVLTYGDVIYFFSVPCERPGSDGRAGARAGTGVAMDAVFRTAEVPAPERFPIWRDMMSQMLTPVEVRSERSADFHADLSLTDLGAIQVSRVTCASFEVRRGPKLIRQSDPELYQLSLNLGGRAGVTQADRQAEVGLNQFVLYDTSRPFHAWTAAEPGVAKGVTRGVTRGVAKGVGVAFPRTLLPLHPNKARQLIARPLPGRDGIGALLAQFVAGLGDSVDRVGLNGRARLSTILLDLLAALLAQQLEAETALPPETYHHALLLRIRAFIQQRLGDRALTPSTIAAAHHISTRHLHRLFHEQGDTVAGWIRAQRLERCRRELADPLLGSRPIHVIAARWGFIDAAHFNRVFRAAYGQSPAAYRRQHQTN
jgi:AraC-like DNA-binding protein